MRALPCRSLFFWVKRNVSLKVEALKMLAKFPSACLFDRLANDKLTLNSESFGFYKIWFMASLQHFNSLRWNQSVKNLRICQYSLRVHNVSHLEDTSSKFRLVYIAVNVLVEWHSDLNLLNWCLRLQVLLDRNRIVLSSFRYLRIISQHDFLDVLVYSDSALIRHMHFVFLDWITVNLHTP